MPPTAKTNTTHAAETSRRAFCGGAAALLLAPAGLLRGSGLAAQVQAGAGGTPTRPDVAAIDRSRILAAAERYLTQQPTALTTLQCARSPGTVHDYYSEAAADSDSRTGADAGPETKAGTAPAIFMAHRDALFELGLAVPALAAAYLLTSEERYAEHAAQWLRVWFVDAATRMTPRLDYGHVGHVVEGGRVAIRSEWDAGADGSARTGGRPEGIVETLPLVEVAQAIPFLASSAAMSEEHTKALQAWFAEYLRWLTAPQDSGPRLAALARDRKDHHGTSWMLQASAYATLTASTNEGPKSEAGALAELRHRYKTVTLRAQISGDGTFPHELGSATPFRDSLFNLDMMAAVCLLLSTRFESVWDYQLEDGPGMRSAIAYHFPFMADRTRWPFRADAARFDQLPGRRVSLLFAARAYQRPEYAALWKTLPPDPASPEILRSMPVHQPLLWVRQPPRV
jgi:Alginate lyase